MTPGLPSSLIRAASSGRHRPASHPVLVGHMPLRHVDELPLSGWRIRALRIVRGLSQERLAGLLEVSRPAVAQWESGAYRPSAEHQARLREVLRP